MASQEIGSHGFPLPFAERLLHERHELLLVRGQTAAVLEESGGDGGGADVDQTNRGKRGP